MISTTAYNDTRDLAEALLDADTAEADRRTISQLFEDFGIDAHSPDDIDVTIIPASEFQNYVREMLEDFGTIPVLPSWVEVDWQATADNVAADYIFTSVVINGSEEGFWFRG